MRFYCFSPSSVLSPLVPRGERMESLMQPCEERAGERGQPSSTFLKSQAAPIGTVRAAIQLRDTRTTQRVRFATQQRAILSLPKGEGRVRGKERPENKWVANCR